jgi:hypothetical protein
LPQVVPVTTTGDPHPDGVNAGSYQLPPLPGSVCVAPQLLGVKRKEMPLPVPLLA